MLVAVVSDTHRHSHVFNQIIELSKDTDMMIHLGDNLEDARELEKSYKGNIISVKGNCDFMNSAPSERIEIIGEKRIFITHGHKYDVKYDLLRLKYRAIEVEADIVLFGHTHQSLALYEQGIWFINPGSAALPRDSSKSIAMLEVGNNNVDVTIRSIK